MSRYKRYILLEDIRFTEINESVDRSKALRIIDSILKIEKELSRLIPQIPNQKWKNYIQDFTSSCVTVSDILMRASNR
jgi:hypothetical protein